jgi:mannosyltransferase OCH1-like enzyme
MLALAFFFTISIINTVPVHFNITPNGFPKVIWSYWEQGIEAAPFFTKLCVKNRDRIAEAEGWKHVFLSNSNLNEYIDPEEVESLMAISTKRFIQLKADLIRLLLILKYGGLWIDINSYILGDLSWVSNPKQVLISNQI